METDPDNHKKGFIEEDYHPLLLFLLKGNISPPFPKSDTCFESPKSLKISYSITFQKFDKPPKTYLNIENEISI